MDGACDLELQEQAVAAGGREVGRERHDAGRLVAVVRVDVQVGEVALAQRDQVAAGAEVRLEAGDRPAVAATAKSRSASSPARSGSCCERTVEAVGGGGRAPGRQRLGA